jgi:hypothetical protein
MNRLTQTRTSRAIDATGDGALMSTAALARENLRFAGTGGVSRENRGNSFLPAFLDSGTGEIYLSRFADGRLAPIHMLDGLPEELVVARNARRITAVKASVVSGFVRDRRFYTREQAASSESANDQNALAVNQ